jgi:hypothetical protein
MLYLRQLKNLNPNVLTQRESEIGAEVHVMDEFLHQGRTILAKYDFVDLLGRENDIYS